MKLKEFKNRSYDIEFDLKFMSELIIIGGDSGTGKTLFYNIMRRKSHSNNDVICINIDSISLDINNTLEKAHGKLIIIDNADIILDAKSKYLIVSNSSNQYIIFGRNTHGFHIGAKQYSEMEIKNNRVTLNYILI